MQLTFIAFLCRRTDNTAPANLKHYDSNNAIMKCPLTGLFAYHTLYEVNFTFVPDPKIYPYFDVYIIILLMVLLHINLTTVKAKLKITDGYLYEISSEKSILVISDLSCEKKRSKKARGI
jgi:hypothetical protein